MNENKIFFVMMFGIFVFVTVCFCVFGFVILMVIMVGISVVVISGILVKGVDVLEWVGVLDVVVFDKIGTLITGSFIVIVFIAS